MKFRVTALSAVPLAAIGCHGCRESHPYVPYAIESASTGSQAASHAGSSGPDLPGPASAPHGVERVPATQAPPGLSRWTLAEVTLQAPPAQVFVSALVRDFDRDGRPDAFAVVRSAEGTDPGQLAYYRGQAGAEPLTPPILFSPPAGLAHDPKCTPLSRLMATGETSVFVELGSACPLGTALGPDRWIALVRGASQPMVRFAATVDDPPGAGSLSADLDAVDRDGDGLEDVALRVSLDDSGDSGDQGPRVTALFAWLDRPAGLSRDVGATEAAFAALGNDAMARAGRSKEAAHVPPHVARARSLWHATCAEGGTPRVVVSAGAGGIVCSVGHALDRIALAEVRAYMTQADSLRAVLAFDRAQRWSTTRGAPGFADAQRSIEKLVPVAAARAVRAVAAVPLAIGREPGWGPLTFEPSGKLVVRTGAGLVRVDPETGDEAAAYGATDFKPAITSLDGTLRWSETSDPCDGTSLRAIFAKVGGTETREVALPVTPPVGGRCPRGLPPHTLPVASGASGIEAIVEGEPVLISPDLERASPLSALLSQASVPGGPRSPDGTAIVLPTTAGIFERGTMRARWLRAPELEASYADQRDCVVSNDGAHVACLYGGKAWVGTWDAL